MQKSQRLVFLFAGMLFLIFPSSWCQTDARRAVTEHQLMHDRGRNIQSLKRLIWLSSAIEGLHTAQARSADSNPARALSLALNPALMPIVDDTQQNKVQGILKDFFHPHSSHYSDEED